MHFYRFHVGDYLSHTHHLTPMEDLAYRKMLDYAYLHERGLEGDAASIARAIGLRGHEKEVASVLSDFWFCTDGVWKNNRVEKELAMMADKQAKAVAAGKASGAVRRTLNVRSTDAERTFNGRPTIQDSNTPRPLDSKTPRRQDTKTPVPDSLPAPRPVASLPFEDMEPAIEPPVKPKRPKDAIIEAVVATPEFQRFWSAYDLKKGRDEAAKSWAKINPDADLAEKIILAAKHYAEDNPDKAYRKHPSTWLNQKCWEDERVSKSKAIPDGGFDRFGNWKGVPRGKQDYSNVITEDDPLGMHPKQLLARENGIRASKSLPPLTMEQWEAENPPGTY